jgi:hypothetical protein
MSYGIAASVFRDEVANKEARQDAIDITCQRRNSTEQWYYCWRTFLNKNYLRDVSHLIEKLHKQ